jgi:hypothetical protein
MESDRKMYHREFSGCLKRQSLENRIENAPPENDSIAFGQMKSGGTFANFIQSDPRSGR